jgi:hypothetical protein
MKAIDNKNFKQLQPPISSLASGKQGQKINNLSINPQKVNYNPIKPKCQEKKSENIKENGK